MKPFIDFKKLVITVYGIYLFHRRKDIVEILFAPCTSEDYAIYLATLINYHHRDSNSLEYRQTRLTRLGKLSRYKSNFYFSKISCMHAIIYSYTVMSLMPDLLEFSVSSVFRYCKFNSVKLYVYLYFLKL